MSQTTTNEKIEILRGMESNDFAQSLVSQFDKRGELSHKQWVWVDKLSEQDKIEAMDEGVKLDVSEVVQLLAKLGAHVKYPKIRLTSEAGTQYIVKRSRAGDVHMEADEWEFNQNFGREARIWMGKVTNGTFNPSRRCRIEAIELLKELSANPMETLTKYGHLTGNCAVCGRPLSDERSLALGIGPVCATRLGLSEDWKDGSLEVA